MLNVQGWVTHKLHLSWPPKPGLNVVGSQMFFDRDLPCEFLVSPKLEFVRVGLVVRLLRRVKDVLPNWGFSQFSCNN
jgi:hypothetical protein